MDGFFAKNGCFYIVFWVEQIVAALKEIIFNFLKFWAMSITVVLKQKISSLHVGLDFFEDMLDIQKGKLFSEKWDLETIKKVHQKLREVFDLKLPNMQDMLSL